MSAHRLPSDLGLADFGQADPGNGGALPNSLYCRIDLVTAAAETRTLAAPTKDDLRIRLNLLTDGGDCVVTAASAINQTGNTIMTLNDAGDCIDLESIKFGTGYRWRVVFNDGVTLS